MYFRCISNATLAYLLYVCFGHDCVLVENIAVLRKNMINDVAVEMSMTKIDESFWTHCALQISFSPLNGSSQIAVS